MASDTRVSLRSIFPGLQLSRAPAFGCSADFNGVTPPKTSLSLRLGAASSQSARRRHRTAQTRCLFSFLTWCEISWDDQRQAWQSSRRQHASSRLSGAPSLPQLSRDEKHSRVFSESRLVSCPRRGQLTRKSSAAAPAWIWSDF